MEAPVSTGGDEAHPVQVQSVATSVTMIVQCSTNARVALCKVR